MKCDLLISEDLGETWMDPGLRNICAWGGLGDTRNKVSKGDESEHIPYIQNPNGKTFSCHYFNFSC